MNNSAGCDETDEICDETDEINAAVAKTGHRRTRRAVRTACPTGQDTGCHVGGLRRYSASRASEKKVGNTCREQKRLYRLYRTTAVAKS